MTGMPHIPEGHRFGIVPDWICEILSSSTASKDREIKLPLHLAFGLASGKSLPSVGR